MEQASVGKCRRLGEKKDDGNQYFLTQRKDMDKI